MDTTAGKRAVLRRWLYAFLAGSAAAMPVGDSEAWLAARHVTAHGDLVVP